MSTRVGLCPGAWFRPVYPLIPTYRLHTVKVIFACNRLRVPCQHIEARAVDRLTRGVGPQDELDLASTGEGGDNEVTIATRAGPQAELDLICAVDLAVLHGLRAHRRRRDGLRVERAIDHPRALAGGALAPTRAVLQWLADVEARAPPVQGEAQACEELTCPDLLVRGSSARWHTAPRCRYVPE